MAARFARAFARGLRRDAAKALGAGLLVSAPAVALCDNITSRTTTTTSPAGPPVANSVIVLDINGKHRDQSLRSILLQMVINAITHSYIRFCRSSVSLPRSRRRDVVDHHYDAGRRHTCGWPFHAAVGFGSRGAFLLLLSREAISCGCPRLSRSSWEIGARMR